MASPFSFHCMICFEEFDTECRYPVVLPCGHTYICNQCAERLERCMECRTSLFQVIPRGPEPPSHQHPTAAGGRWGSRSGSSRLPNPPRTPPQPPIKKRLPLPKNVVLLSLIEATQLATENVNDQQPSISDSPMMRVAPSIVDLEEDEEEKIRAGTSLAISDCGTYAVASRDGLEIFPSRPESAFQSGHEESEEDVDTLVRFFHLDHKLDIDGDDEIHNQERGGKCAPPGKLAWGDRVQIVSTEAGWAKLGRGYGYVRADGLQLVKVGGSVDRACKLEALLRHLSGRRKGLRNEQMRIDNQFTTLMNDLQVSLMADEDLTVIGADTFRQKIPADGSGEIQPEVRDNESSGHPPGQEIRSNNNDDSTPLKPRPMERPVTPPGDITRGFFCAGAVFDTMIPLSAGATSRQPPALPSASESPAIAEVLERSNSIVSTPPRLFPPAPQPTPSPTALRAGARAWREMHGRQASVQLGVDFRTGMSGHSALLSSAAHSYEPPVTSFLGMSNHTGLTMWKPARRNRSSSLSMPSFGGSTTQDDSSTADLSQDSPTR